MTTSTGADTVWGIFVGENGNQLEIFNSKTGPFPPQPESEGIIAIGWPAIGDLMMFKDRYLDYVEKFRRVYQEDEAENVFKTKANMPWNFAFTMKIGDWVICPSSSLGLILVGKIIGEYKSDFHDELGLYGIKRVDFVHTRKVQWKHIIHKGDPRYSMLNRIGQLTVTRPDISPTNLDNL